MTSNSDSNEYTELSFDFEEGILKYNDLFYRMYNHNDFYKEIDIISSDYCSISRNFFDQLPYVNDTGISYKYYKFSDTSLDILYQFLINSENGDFLLPMNMYSADDIDISKKEMIDNELKDYVIELSQQLIDNELFLYIALEDVWFDDFGQKVLEEILVKEKIQKTVLNVIVDYNGNSYNLNLDDIYKLSSILSDVTYNRVSKDSEFDFNYSIVIELLNGRTILFQSNGDIYYKGIKESERCYKYHIRNEVDRRLLENIIVSLVG